MMKETPHILHSIDAYDLTGPAKTVMNSCLFTDDARYRKSVAVFSQGGKNRYSRELVRRGVKVFEIEEGGAGYLSKVPASLRIIRDLRRIIVEQEVDLVHTHGYKADVLGYPASRLAGRKIVTTQHGYIEIYPQLKVYRRLAIAAAARMDCVIAVSDGTAERLIGFGVPRGKVVTVRNAIVSADYAVRERDEELLERLSLAGRAPIIGCIGRVSPEKGQRVLLDAFREVRRRFPGACLVVVGSGPDLENLRSRFTRERDGVVFVGHQEDVRPFISVLDLHVLPSYTEGLPNVVLETGCMGVVTVGTAVGGTPECIVDGVTGLLVQPGRADELARAISSVLGNDEFRRELERNVAEFVRKEFGFGNRVLKMFGIYDRLLNNHYPLG